MQIIDTKDCKFCEFPALEPSIYDTPEVRKSHALHLLSFLNLGVGEWDAITQTAAKFAGK